MFNSKKKGQKWICLQLLLSDELNGYSSDMEKRIATLRTDFPVSYRYALTCKAIRMLLCERRRTIRHYAESGLISAKEMYEQINNIQNQNKL